MCLCCGDQLYKDTDRILSILPMLGMLPLPGVVLQGNTPVAGDVPAAVKQVQEIIYAS